MAYELLAASDVLRTIGSVLLAVLILLVMITIHEFGHYLAGKLFKFKIDEFSVGFGPALFKRRSKKTGELFAVRLIPLGGYCAFAGEDGLEEEKEREREEERVDDAAERREEEDKSGYFTNRPCWQRIIVLVSGALMNYLLALLLIIVGFLAYGQTAVKVNSVDLSPDLPSAYLTERLQAGDILLKAEGKSLYLANDIARFLNGKKTDDRVTLTVSRGGKIEEVEVILRADVEVKNSTQVGAVYKALGVGVVEREDGRYYDLEEAVFRFGFFESLGRSFVYSFKIAGSIFRVLGELLTGKLGLEAFGGPVTTITMTSEIASRGFRYFLEIAGYIGVNLAVFNLLPIPALDGSKVVFTAIEWVRGKPISRKVEAIIHAVGFVLLLGFAVLVDILQFI